MRMKKLATLCLISITLIVPSLCVYSANQGPADKPVFGNAGAEINKNEIPGLKTNALNGSGFAAHRLARYYALILNDFNAELYWERIAAENGDSPIYMYSYAQILGNLPNVDDNEKERVQFWLKKAANAGYEPAKK